MIFVAEFEFQQNDREWIGSEVISQKGQLFFAFYEGGKMGVFPSLADHAIAAQTQYPCHQLSWIKKGTKDYLEQGDWFQDMGFSFEEIGRIVLYFATNDKQLVEPLNLGYLP